MTCPLSPGPQVSLPPRPVLFPLFLIESPSQNIHLPLTSASTDPAGWTGIWIPEHPYPIPCGFNLAQPLALPGSFGARGTCYKIFFPWPPANCPATLSLLPGWGRKGTRTWPLLKAPSLTLHQLGCGSRGRRSVLPQH